MAKNFLLGFEWCLSLFSLDSVFIFFINSALTGVFATFLSLRCSKQQLSDGFFALFFIILLGVVDLFVLAVFFGAISTFRSSKSTIGTYLAKLLSLSLRIYFL